jgi:putative endonuclease
MPGVAAKVASWLGRGNASRRDPLGPRGERIAMKHLRAKGYRRLGANVRTGSGEIDLIALAPDKRTIVFVEVKAKRVSDDGARVSPPPEASVHARKRAKLLLVAKQVARAKGWTDRPLRIDVVAVEAPDRGAPTVRHYENAVTG